ISRSQWAPEICSSCSSRLTSFSQSRKSQEREVESIAAALAVAMGLLLKSLLDQFQRARMKDIFCRNFLCSDPLSITIAKERLEHVSVGFQAIGPGVGLKNFLFFGEVVIRPSFNQTWNRPAPALRPAFCLAVNSEKFFRELGMAVQKPFLQRYHMHDWQDLGSTKISGLDLARPFE